MCQIAGPEHMPDDDMVVRILHGLNFAEDQLVRHRLLIRAAL